MRKLRWNRFIREILFDPNETAHGPIELADILTPVHVRGEKCLAGFVLKGEKFQNSYKSECESSVRQTRHHRRAEGGPSFAAVGTVQDEVRRNFSTKAKTEGWHWMIMHAIDLARLFIAYGKICPQDGPPFDARTQKCRYGHLRTSR